MNTRNGKPRKNLEIKARCPDLRVAARAAKSLHARRAGVLHQTDTYFHPRHGRLKLREIREGRSSRAELIAYERADRASARESRYFVVPVLDATLLKSALKSAMGIRAVVKKRRELWMYHNVRVHLDRVEGLGTFIEFEAVLDGESSPSLSRKRLDALCEALRVNPGKQLAHSYVDLLMRRER